MLTRSHAHAHAHATTPPLSIAIWVAKQARVTVRHPSYSSGLTGFPSRCLSCVPPELEALDTLDTSHETRLVTWSCGVTCVRRRGFRVEQSGCADDPMITCTQVARGDSSWRATEGRKSQPCRRWRKHAHEVAWSSCLVSPNCSFWESLREPPQRLGTYALRLDDKRPRLE
jgi:hypothetical protein